MSSHHIVKEKQEPALYIHELGNFDEEYLGQLLEWSPTIITSGQEYEKVISLGLKVDFVIGDIDTTLLQEHTKVIAPNGGLMDTTLRYLIAEKYPAVNIISKVSKFDDLIDFVPYINIVLFTGNEKYYVIKKDFSVWKPRDSVFLIDIISYFETDNLEQQDDGTFVVIEDGMVSFNFNTPFLFIGERI